MHPTGTIKDAILRYNRAGDAIEHGPPRVFRRRIHPTSQLAWYRKYERYKYDASALSHLQYYKTVHLAGWALSLSCS